MAKKAARQVLAEPGEMLKSARTQIEGANPEASAPQVGSSPPPEINPEAKIKLAAQTKRHLQALEAEIKDMVRQRADKQRQIVANENQNQAPVKKSISEPQTKKSRKLGMGWGRKLKELTTQTETRQQSVG